MRITLSGAMRARDVSRPSDEQLAAAKREEAADRAGGAGPGAADPAVRAGRGPTPTPARAPTPTPTPAPAPARRRRRRRG